MVFGVDKAYPLPALEGDDISMFHHEWVDSMMILKRERSSSDYRRKMETSMNQFDVTIDDNDYVLATSIPIVLTSSSASKPMTTRPEQGKDMDVQVTVEEDLINDRTSECGSRSWYSRLSSFSQEAFTFMQSDLTVVSDFDSLRVPDDMKRDRFTKLFSRFRQQTATMMERPSFSMRDEARELLEQYIAESDLSMMMPPIMIEEQARLGYYRSIFFNTSRIESKGTGKVVLPRTKPYSTWLVIGFALNSKSGLSIAQPIHLPTIQGLFVLGDCPYAKLALANILSSLMVLTTTSGQRC